MINEELVIRVREGLKSFSKDIEEKKMFGGLTFMYKGKMSVGIIKNELAVRVVSEKMEAALSDEGTRKMDFTGKPLKEFLYVSEEAFDTEEKLMHWINLGIEHAERNTK